MVDGSKNLTIFPVIVLAKITQVLTNSELMQENVAGYRLLETKQKSKASGKE